MHDFGGRVLWLTSANGVISREIARIFFGLGAFCVLTDLYETGIKDFAWELDSTGERVVGLRQDAGKSGDANAVAAEISRRFGKLDFLVTSADLYRDQMIHDLTDEQWKLSTAVNLDGVFFTCRAAIPLLAKGGAVVNVASVAGHCGSYNHSSYATSKGGVLTFTRTGFGACSRCSGECRVPRPHRYADGQDLARKAGAATDRFDAAQAHGPATRSGADRGLSLLGLGRLHHRRNCPHQRRPLHRQLMGPANAQENGS